MPSLARLFQRWPSGEVYPNVSARLIEYLLGLPFEKNIRDLEALVTLAVDESHDDRIEMFTKETLRTVVEPTWGPKPNASVPPGPSSSERPSSAPRSAAPTNEQVLASLEHSFWNVRATAKALAISEPRLYRLMERYGIKRPGK